jgi:hypothetical protein
MGYEEKLRFAKALDELSGEYSAYMTVVKRFIDREKSSFSKLSELESALDAVHSGFDVEKTELGEDGEIVGKVFRAEK